MAQRILRKHLESKAEQCGLKLDYYNPGDGGRYSVGPNGEYFTNEYFYGTASEVNAYLAGWITGLYKTESTAETKRAIAQQ